MLRELLGPPPKSAESNKNNGKGAKSSQNPKNGGAKVPQKNGKVRKEGWAQPKKSRKGNPKPKNGNKK